MPKDATLIIGANVRRVRAEKRLSQEALADKAELHRTYIGGIERGERNITVINLLKISLALECDIVELFVGLR
jgi:transcriptional regulator with XRE-family HTH domain